MSEKFSKVMKQANEIKDQALALGKDALKGAGAFAGMLKLGFNTSKTAVKKAKKVVNKEKLGEGLEKASRGVDMAAKGTKGLANAMGAVSHEMKHLGGKLKSTPKKNTKNVTK